MLGLPKNTNIGEWFADTEALARAVNGGLTREVCVLVKGSRSARLERVVEALVGKPAQQDDKYGHH